MIAITNDEFLEAMFADLPDEACAMVCGFAGDPCTVRRGAWFARPWAFGSRIGAGPCLNTYTAVSSFRPDPVLGEYRRRKANFARLHAVMLDDLGTKLAMRHADRLPVAALIETSPNNHQAWLFLTPDEQTDTRESAERLINAMIRQGLAANTDPGMSGVTRYGRLPVGVNGKEKYLRDGRSFPVRIERWNPEFRYSVAHVALAFGLDLTPEPPVLRPTVSLPTAHARIDDFGALLAWLRTHGHYIDGLGEGRHAICCPWIGEHSDRAESGTAILEPSLANSWAGGFRCHHGHCEGRGIGDVYRYVRGTARSAA